MSIWGKILGGAAGFAIGGPLGALIGAVAGHAVDEMRGDEPADSSKETGDATRSVAFTVGVIVLGAKMAKADGQVHPMEVAAFKRVFQVPPEELKNVGRLFDIAKRDSAGFEPYARQLGGLFKDRPAVLEDLLGGLFHIAAADHVLHPAEIAYLRGVARLFDLDEAAFERVRAIHGGAAAGVAGGEEDPFAILGVAPTAGMDEIKAAYRRLARENHPDLLLAQGLPQEFINVAQAKLAAVNAAYEKIEKSRKAMA